MNLTRPFFGLFFAILLGPAKVLAGDVSISKTNYHGWPESIAIRNDTVEAIVVPAIGRVMQFRFLGEQDGPFWENRALDGKKPDPDAKEWGNFGGDKTWPAPQSDWPKLTPRSWPPPPVFDSVPLRPSETATEVTLHSATDRFYGLRTIRHITLEKDKPVMKIKTTYEKLEGQPVNVGVWIITQLKDPVAVVAPLPDHSLNAAGYNKQSDDLPTNLRVANGMVSLTRDTKKPHKIGTDAGTLLWVGDKIIVQIDSPRLAEGEYPDQKSSAEVYTNPDPAAYVELEMLGPLKMMKPGDLISTTNTYTLIRRREADPAKEIRKLLHRE